MNPVLDQITLDFKPGSLLALNIILGLLMFGVAMDLKVSDFTDVLKKPKGPLVGLACQLLILPPATFLLVSVITPIPSVALGLMLVAACPGGNVSNFLVWMSRGNAALSVGMTAISTAVAIIATPLNLTFWASMYGPTRKILTDVNVDPVAMFGTVGLILLLPLVAGMSIRHRFPGIADKVRRPLRLIGGLVFLSFIAIAFFKNRMYLTGDVMPVLAIVAVHNAMALSIGYSVARLMGLSPADRRAVSIEVGIQNSGLGLVLIFTFFKGLGGMAIVAAWWGAWHLVGGLTMATIWSRIDPDVTLADAMGPAPTPAE